MNVCERDCRYWYLMRLSRLSKCEQGRYGGTEKFAFAAASLTTSPLRQDDLLTFAVYRCCETLTLEHSQTASQTDRHTVWPTISSAGTRRQISLSFIIRTTTPKLALGVSRTLAKFRVYRMEESIVKREAETER